MRHKQKTQKTDIWKTSKAFHREKIWCLCLNVPSRALFELALQRGEMKRQTDRQTDRQADRQTIRQTDRQRKSEGL